MTTDDTIHAVGTYRAQSYNEVGVCRGRTRQDLPVGAVRVQCHGFFDLTPGARLHRELAVQPLPGVIDHGLTAGANRSGDVFTGFLRFHVLEDVQHRYTAVGLSA